MRLKETKQIVETERRNCVSHGSVLLHLPRSRALAIRTISSKTKEKVFRHFAHSIESKQRREEGRKVWRKEASKKNNWRSKFSFDIHCFSTVRPSVPSKLETLINMFSCRKSITIGPWREFLGEAGKNLINECSPLPSLLQCRQMIVRYCTGSGRLICSYFYRNFCNNTTLK